MKATTWIAIVLTVWVTVDLGTRAYVYNEVYQIEQAFQAEVRKNENAEAVAAKRTADHKAKLAAMTFEECKEYNLSISDSFKTWSESTWKMYCNQ